MKCPVFYFHDFGQTLLTEEAEQYIGRGNPDWLKLVNNKRVRRAEVIEMRRRLEEVEAAIRVLALIAFDRGEELLRFPPKRLGDDE